MTVRILEGDCRDLLRTLPAESVHCCVTSPPYYGLRDYGTAEWAGAGESCDHVAGMARQDTERETPGGKGGSFQGGEIQFRQICGKCGARRIDRQLGLEDTPDAYVAEMVAVFREVRRVLRADGTLWLNIGDSYANDGKWGGETGGKQSYLDDNTRKRVGREKRRTGLKPKDLIGIPWLLAFALRADGWVLRQEIIWSKPNPMPESVTDRCTKAHEQLFLYSKARRIGPEPSKYDDIPEGEARWLAALFDGEGSLVCRREADKGADYGAHAAQVSIGGTSRALIERLAGVIGEGSVLEREGQNAPMHYWQTSGKRALGLLRRIYPFMIAKQKQARCLIALEERKTIRGGHARLTVAEISLRDQIWNAVKALNHFGEPNLSGIPEPIFGRWDSQRYHYDQEAILEVCSPNTHARLSQDVQAQIGSDLAHAGGKTNGTMKAVGRHLPGNKTHKGTTAYEAGDERHRTKAGLVEYAQRQRKLAEAGSGIKNNDSMDAALAIMPAKRNRRSVWEIATQPFSEAHFATFPPALVEPCILAGCPVGGTVLDPFLGAGTTALVADRLGRDCIGIELNPEYATMAKQRIEADGPLFADVAAE